MTFKNFEFSENQIKKYLIAAQKDYKIAISNSNDDVKFRFSYDALLKLAIAVCAQENLRVEARAGHHKELIDKLSNILKMSDIKKIGNEMRKKRNFDLYSGGPSFSSKEAKDFSDWVGDVFKKGEEYIKLKKGQNRML